MADDKVSLSTDTRYVDTTLLKDALTKKLYFDLWEVPLDESFFDQTVDDIEHTIEANEVGCLDMLAWKYYDNEHLWWIIAWYNGVVNPVTEMSAGQILKIPSPTKVMEKWGKT